MVEVATIGCEGMVGMNAVLAGTPVSSTSLVQGETGTCCRMKADAFRREMERRGVFHDVLSHYTQALVGFIMQSTVCNAVHSVEQRLARWLLMARDRMASDDVPLTPEFVAMMLGASRPTVTIVASTLQKAGLITYRRGQVTIVDGEGLEAASCECYRATTDLLNAVTQRARLHGGWRPRPPRGGRGEVRYVLDNASPDLVPADHRRRTHRPQTLPTGDEFRRRQQIRLPHLVR